MMRIRWSQWIVGCFLLGILSEGYAGRVIKWTPEEDEVLIEFVKAWRSNPYLTWQDCANALNQHLERNGANHRRTKEACRERWDHYLKQRFSQLRKPHTPGKYHWPEDENAQLVESMRRHTNDGRTDWKAVSRDMRDRSAVQCRMHYGVLASHGFSPEEAPEEEGPQDDGPDAVDPNIPVFEEDVEFEDPGEDPFFGGC
jgi:hypothetical protein